MIDTSHWCGCAGARHGEPYCPCLMVVKGLKTEENKWDKVFTKEQLQEMSEPPEKL